MKFIEIEYVTSECGKKINKILIQKDCILSVVKAHCKNPILYYKSHQGIASTEMIIGRYVHLTQESYKKIKNELTKE